MGKPFIIGHRGASGERPEHTLAAYALAFDQGADFVEPDVVPTKDGHLVARHENEISGTTDVADHPEFAHRRTTRTIDGQTLTGWFTEDFTLAELSTLRARERLLQLRPANTAWKDEPIVTLDALIGYARERGRGVVAEIKHSSYFASIGLALEEKLVALFARHGWTRRTDPVWIESFEVANLKALRAASDLKLVQLLEEKGAPADGSAESYAAMATPAGLKAIAGYADAIGPAKALIVPRDADGRSLPPTRLVDDAHAAGLKVIPWTFRSENLFLPAELREGADPREHGRAADELRMFAAAGVDGLFTDFPGEAVTVFESSPRP
ncbi:glycerophosphodiester phosphodiesterase [Sphingomonas sp. MAH-20]|uniref:glycerophosphodiester phosphodiesterase n=1 Tax=Sphingomonas horti TaxID=2682842 RepID=A0A6I4J4Y2_9SPHN|nr:MULTISPECIES: glycerophosphodiester phosphodiesterase [Sphingomonas]MBA2919116.1 glycerophosphodiester phosphodiesterase [Sphingomonas sp. CGMCC 1.13658]MVO79148.1 glycerophosphodiester phosphodiesterase [Sphingomonas horti]